MQLDYQDNLFIHDWRVAKGGERVEDSLVRVEGLTQQLLDLGYAPFQVDSMINEAVGTLQLEKVNLDQIALVIEILEEYIQFAKKCLNV